PVSGWISGSERKIAWQLYTNYQKQNLGTGVSITDTLQYDGKIDLDSIEVKTYIVSASGDTNITGPTLDATNNYTATLSDDEKSFTLTFAEGFDVKERYVIEFTTTVPDISQGEYTNTATVKVGDKEYPYKGTVNYDKHNKFLNK